MVLGCRVLAVSDRRYRPKPALDDRPLSGAVADEPLDPTCRFDLQPRIQHARM